MKKFLHPCFVRVEDAEQKEELIKWLDKIGYEICRCVYFDGTIAISVGDGRVHGILETDEFGCPHYDIAVYEAKDGIGKDIDCGSDMEIFKAIAAINDENDKEQWFTDGMRWYKVTTNIAPCDISFFRYHKGTSEEIIEHFAK